MSVLSSEGMPPKESCSRAKSLLFLLSKGRLNMARLDHRPGEKVLVFAVARRSVLATLAAMKEVPMSDVAVPDPKTPIPRQIRYIIGNEGCERFSFYGMRNILTVFLVTSLLTYLPEGDRPGAAKDVFHTFVSAFTFSRCWAAGWPIVSLANTTRSSG